ncbi:MAG: apolipoprotein N-acyltransferase [Actinomycetota bacterium]|nr:apolipoprotein N-acyltransferase [Actinomycetota bacterium]
MAFPPVDAGWVAFVALVPLALVFKQARPLELGAASAAFGLVFFGALVEWIRLFGVPAFVGLVVVQTLWIVLALQLGRLFRDRLATDWKLIAFPVAMLAGEFARAHLPWGGFAWGGLGYTQHDNLPLLRMASYTGVWGVSFVIALVNSLLTEALLVLRKRPRKALVCLAAAGVAAVAPALLPVPTPQGRSARLALVQGNVPEGTVDPSSDDDVVLRNHLGLTRQIQSKDVSMVVWPEGAVEKDPFNPEVIASFREAVGITGAPLLAGATFESPTPPPPGPKNTSLMFGKEGTFEGMYVKQRLVPFGEWVPLRKFLEPLVPDIQRVPFDLVPGRRSTVFSIGEGRLASVICYENTYPGLVRSFVQQGARMLVVSTNNSSYGRSPQSEQHLAFSQVRAAEQRMWVAHAAVSGISGVVTPEGRVTETTGLFAPAVMTPTVRFATTVTPYARFGDWLPFACLAVLILGAATRKGWNRDKAKSG